LNASFGKISLELLRMNDLFLLHDTICLSQSFEIQACHYAGFDFFSWNSKRRAFYHFCRVKVLEIGKTRSLLT